MTPIPTRSSAPHATSALRIYLLLAALLAAFLLAGCANLGQLQGKKSSPRFGELLTIEGPKTLGAVRLSLAYGANVDEVVWADPKRVVVAERDPLGRPTEVVVLLPVRRNVFLNYQAIVIANRGRPSYTVQVKEASAGKVGKYELLSISAVTTKSRHVTVR